MNDNFLDNKIDFKLLSENDLDGAQAAGPDDLLALTRTEMPFGKYKGVVLMDLPEDYVTWFARKGFPKGRIGELLAILNEIKINGLEFLFNPFRG